MAFKNSYRHTLDRDGKGKKGPNSCILPFFGFDYGSDTDSYTSLAKQAKLLDIILTFNKLGKKALDAGADMKKLFAISARERIGRAKDVSEADYAVQYQAIEDLMKDEIEALSKEVQ